MHHGEAEGVHEMDQEQPGGQLGGRGLAGRDRDRLGRKLAEVGDVLRGEMLGAGSGLIEETQHFAEFRERVRVERGFEGGETLREQGDRGVPQGFALRGQHHAGAAAVLGDRLAFYDAARDVQVDRLGDRAGAEAGILRETFDLGHRIRILQEVFHDGELRE